jgi:hypothetical protein
VAFTIDTSGTLHKGSTIDELSVSIGYVTSAEASWKNGLGRHRVTANQTGTPSTSARSLDLFRFGSSADAILANDRLERVVGIHSRNAGRFSGYFGKLSVLPARPVGYARLSTTRANLFVKTTWFRNGQSCRQSSSPRRRMWNGTERYISISTWQYSRFSRQRFTGRWLRGYCAKTKWLGRGSLRAVDANYIEESVFHIIGLMLLLIIHDTHAIQWL